MHIVRGAPAGVVARGRRGGQCVVLIPDADDEAVYELAALVLDQRELEELERHLSARVAASGVAALSGDARL